jgi:excisionase family DNA binding protein
MSTSNGAQGTSAGLVASANEAASTGLLGELVELIAARAAAIVRDDQEVQPEPWLGVQEAASHLACPTSRIYALVSARRIPHHRDGSRLLFRRSEVDAWVERGGATRP